MLCVGTNIPDAVKTSQERIMLLFCRQKKGFEKTEVTAEEVANMQSCD